MSTEQPPLPSTLPPVSPHGWRVLASLAWSGASTTWDGHPTDAAVRVALAHLVEHGHVTHHPGPITTTWQVTSRGRIAVAAQPAETTRWVHLDGLTARGSKPRRRARAGGPGGPEPELTLWGWLDEGAR